MRASALSLEAGENQKTHHRGFEFPEKIKRIGANFDNFQSSII